MQSLYGPVVSQKALFQRSAVPARSHSVQVHCVARSGRDDPADAVSTAPLRHLAVAAATLQLLTFPAQAMWDGESSALGSCPLGDAGIECRKAVIAKDDLGSYSNAVDNGAKIGVKATGVPVADLGSDYAKETTAVGNAILQYIKGDVFDEGRPALVKQIKSQGAAWVSKYARGGSARTLSARRFYIAVDAVGGHVASNGLAPFPRNKIDKVVTDVNDAFNLIAQGK